MASRTALSLVLEASDHVQHLELIIERKVAAEAEARANAVTPELQAAIEAHTARLSSIIKLHEAAAAVQPTAAAATVAPAATPGATKAASVL